MAIAGENGCGVYEWEAKNPFPKPAVENTADTGRSGKNAPADTKAASQPKTSKSSSKSLSKDQLNFLHAELKRTGVNMEEVKERYQMEEPEKMPPELYNRVMKALAKTKSAPAA